MKMKFVAVVLSLVTVVSALENWTGVVDFVVVGTTDAPVETRTL